MSAIIDDILTGNTGGDDKNKKSTSTNTNLQGQAPVLTVDDILRGNYKSGSRSNIFTETAGYGKSWATNEDVRDMDFRSPYFSKDELEEIRAERFGIGESVAHGIGRLAGTTVTKAATSISDILIGIPSALIQQDASALFENPVSRAIMDIEESIKEALPIYNTKADQNKNFLHRALTDLDYWTDDLVDGAAFIASAYLTGYGASKLIGPATKSLYGKRLSDATRLSIGELGALEQAASMGDKAAIKVLNANSLQKTPLNKVTKELSEWTVGSVARSIESIAEGKQTYDEVYSDLLNQGYDDSTAKKKAAEAAMSTVGLNMLLLPLEKMQAASWFRRYNNSRKALLDVLEDGTIALPKKAVTKQIGKEFATQAFSEGIVEEGLQHAFQEYNKKKYLEPDYEDLGTISGVFKEYMNAFTTKEGWDAMGAGMILGGLFGASAKAIGEGGKAERKQLEDLKKLIDANQFKNDTFGKFITKDEKTGELKVDKNAIIKTIQEYAQSGKLQEAQELAAKAGSEELFNYFKDQQFNRWAFTHFEAGLGERLLNEIDSLKDLTNEQLAQQGIVLPEMKDSKGNVIDGKTISREYRQKALELEQLYNQLTDRFGGITPAVRNQIFNEALVQKSLKEGLEALNNKVSIKQAELEKDKNLFAEALSEAAEELSDELQGSPSKKDLEALEKERKAFIKELRKSYKRFDELTNPQTIEKKAKEAKKKEEEATKIVNEKETKAAKDETELKEFEAEYNTGDIVEVDIDGQILEGTVIQDASGNKFLEVHKPTGGVTRYAINELFKNKNKYKPRKLDEAALSLRNKANEDFIDAASRLATINELLSQLDRRIDSINRKITAKENEANKILEEISNITKDKKKIKNKFILEKIEKLNNIYYSIQSEISKLESEKNDLESKRPELASLNLVDLDGRAVQLEKLIEDTEKAISTAKESLSILKQIINKLKAALRGKYEYFKKLLDKVNSIKELDNLPVNSKENIALNEEITLRENEAAILENLIKEKERLLEQYKAELKPLAKYKKVLDKHKKRYSSLFKQSTNSVSRPGEISFNEQESNDTKDNSLDVAKTTHKLTRKAKPNLYSTAGLDVLYTGEYEDIFNEEGQLEFNTENDADKWFDYLRDPKNNTVDNNYFLRAEAQEDGTIKVFLYNGTEPVIVDGVHLYAFIHEPTYYDRVLASETRPGETEEEYNKRRVDDIQKFEDFRNKIKSSDKPVYLKVTGKSNGILNTIVTRNGQRARNNVEETFGVDDNLHKSLFVAQTTENNKTPHIVLPDGSIKNVRKSGALYYFIPNANGQVILGPEGTVAELVPNNISSKNADLIIDILKYISNISNGDLSNFRQNHIMIDGFKYYLVPSKQSENIQDKSYSIIGSLIYWGNNNQNPKTAIYFDYEANSLVFGENTITMDKIADEQNQKLLKDWLLENKLNNVSKKLLDQQRDNTSKHLEITNWEIKDKKLEIKNYNLYDSYAKYLTAHATPGSKSIAPQKRTPIFSTDVVGNVNNTGKRFLSVYFSYDSNNLYDQPIAKTTSTQKVTLTGTSLSNVLGNKSEPVSPTNNPTVNESVMSAFGDINQAVDITNIDIDIKEGMQEEVPVDNTGIVIDDASQAALEALNIQSASQPVISKTEVNSETTTGSALDINLTESGDIALPFNFRLKTDNNPYEKIDMEKEEAWFRERFPQIKFLKVSDLIEVAKYGQEAFGRFYVSAEKLGTVEVSEVAEVGTVYHEAFHVVSQLFLNDKQRLSLYNDYRKRHNKPNATDLEVEEALAEEFRDYVLSDGKLKFNKEEKTKKNFFQKIFDFFKHLILGKPLDADTLFNKINKGMYANATPITRNLNKLNTTNNNFFRVRIFNYTDDNNVTRKVSLTQEQVKTALDAMNIIFMNIYTKRGFSQKHLSKISDKGMLEVYYYPMLLDYIKEANSVADTKLYSLIIQNWNEFSKLHYDNLSEFGLSTFNEVEEYDEIKINDRNSGLDFKPSVEFSSKNGLPNTIKLLIRNLFEYKDASVFNDKGNLYTAIAKGEVKLVDFDKTWAILAETLNGITDMPSMINVLKNNVNQYPWMYQILDHLGVTEDLTIKDLDQARLLYDFVQAFSKTKNDYVKTIVDRDGNIYSIDAITEKLESKIRKEFLSGIKNSKYSIGTKEEKLKLYNSVKDNDKLFLDSLGIKLSNEETYKKAKGIVAELKAEVLKSINEDKQITEWFNYGDNISAGRFKQLINMEALNSVDEIELNFINSEGKSVYAVTLYNYLAQIINDLKNNKVLPQLDTANNKNIVHSTWLGQIKNNSKLQIVIRDGISAEEESKHHSKLSEKDIIISRIIDLLDNKIHTLLRPADKKLEYGLKGLKVFTKEDIQIDNNRVSVNPELQRQFFGYVLDELNRINSYDTLEGVEEFDKNGKEFLLFDWLSDKLKSDLITYKLPIIEGTKVYDELLDRFRGELFDYLTDYTNNRLLPKLQEFNVTSSDLSKNLQSYKINEIAAIFGVNELISAIEQTKLFFGDLAYFKDFYKRTPGIIATGKIPAIDSYINNLIYRDHFINVLPEQVSEYPTDGTMKVAVYKDVIITSLLTDEYKKYIDPAIVDETYAKLNEADAQGYITLPAFRDYMIRLGGYYWSDSHEAAYKKLMNNQTITKEEFALFSPIKPMHYGPDLNYKDSYVPFYLKLSLVPLLPTMIKGSKLENLNKSLMNNGVGIAVFESGNKVGTPSKVMLNDLYVNNDPNSDIKISNKGELYTNKIRLDYLRLQLDTNQEVKTNILYGTQLRKLLFSNLFGLGVDNNYQLIDFYNNKEVTATELFNEYSDIIDRLTEISKEKLLSELGVTKEEDIYTFNNTEKLLKLIKAEVRQRNLPENIIDGLDELYDKDNPSKLKASLDSLVVRNKIENLFQALVNNRIIKQKTKGTTLIQVASTGFETVGMKTDKEVGSRRLAFVRKNDKNGKEILQAEILVPNMWADKGVKTVEDLAKINPELLDVLGYRIPTQGLNSMVSFKIVGFLPAESGQSVVVPSEIVAQGGSDFDVDKLNIFINNHNFDNKPLSEEQILQNRLNQINHTVLRNSGPNDIIFKQLITPNGSTKLKQLYEEFYDDGSSKVKGSKLIEFPTILDTHVRNMEGKAGVGQSALHNTFHILSQIANLYVVPGFSYNFDFNKTQEGYPSLAGVYDNKGNTLISEMISEFLTAFVDNAKDPFISKMNINPMTTDLALYMISIGADYKFVIEFLNQPIIRDFVKESRINKGLTGKNNLSKNEVIKKIRDKYIKQLNKDSVKLYQYSLYDAKEPEVIKFVNTQYKKDRDNILGNNTFNFNNLRELRQLSEAENAKLQLQLLDDYLRLMEDSKLYTDAINATKDDTFGVGKDLPSAYNYIAKQEKAGIDPTVPIGRVLIPNLKEVYNATFMRGFKNNGAKFSIDLWGQLLLTGSPLYKKFLNEIKSFMNIEGDIQDEKLLDTITDSFLNYVYLVGLDETLVNQNLLKELFLGDNSVGKQILAIKRDPNHPLHNNLFINRYVIPLIKNKSSIDNVQFINKKFNKYTSDQITGSIQELFNTNPALGGKLIDLALFQSGIAESYLSYMKYLPADKMIPVLQRALNLFKEAYIKDQEGITRGFVVQFAKNNWKTVLSKFKLYNMVFNQELQEMIPLYNTNRVYKDGDRILGFSLKKSDYNKVYSNKKYIKMWNPDAKREFIYENMGKDSQDMPVFVIDNPLGNGANLQEWYKTKKKSIIDENNTGLTLEQRNFIADSLGRVNEYNMVKPTPISTIEINETNVEQDNVIEDELTSALLNPVELSVPAKEAPIDNLFDPSLPKINIYADTNENAELSNFAVRPFTFKGVSFNSVEQAYQSLKGGKFDKATYDNRAYIPFNRNGVMTVSKFRGPLGTTTDAQQTELMGQLIKASFEQNPKALQKLLATGKSELTHTQDKGKWGKEFPKLLMEVRQELKVTDNLDNYILKNQEFSIDHPNKETSTPIIDYKIDSKNNFNNIKINVISVNNNVTTAKITYNDGYTFTEDFNTEDFNKKMKMYGIKDKFNNLDNYINSLINSDKSIIFANLIQEVKDKLEAQDITESYFNMGTEEDKRVMLKCLKNNQ